MSPPGSHEFLSMFVASQFEYYLQQDVRGVVKQHDQRADTNAVGTVGETEKEDGRQMVHHLYLKILAK